MQGIRARWWCWLVGTLAFAWVTIAAAQQGTMVIVKPSGKEPAVHTESGEVPKLTLATDAKVELPLERTRVRARISGYVAEVEVAQTFRNDHEKPIEVRYLFPLPENSAVDDMRMVIGARVIRAQIEERARARRIYTAAKRAGQTAALLEQERPNVFTQSVANIEPGHKIDVVVHYLQDLTYDAGSYEFVFPMVVGPRFSPAGVTDAARIATPYLGKGDRNGHDISLELTAAAGAPIRDWEVPTHEVAARTTADGTLRLALSDKDSIPNRDFVLRYRVAAERPQATLFTSPGASGGHFSLVVHPPQLDVEGLVGKRELTFVVDVSGSMFGEPLALCKMAMRAALEQLRPVDTFNVLTFSGATGRAFPAAVPANRGNVAQALDLVDRVRAGGGTMMADAVAAALEPNVETGRHRYVFFLTDGYVGNEAQIIASAEKFVSAIEAKSQRARVFAFGVGSSPNRFLIDGLAKAAKGLGVYASTREDPRRAVNRFFHYIDSPVLSDVTVDWKGSAASEMMPPKLPDLFASRALIVHGKLASIPADLELTAKAGDATVKIPVRVENASVDGATTPVFARLWARAKIQWLEEGLYRGADDGTVKAITALGLEHHLVTRYTSLIAVDATQSIGDGQPTLVEQPVAPPEGVDIGMAGGSELPPAPPHPAPVGREPTSDGPLHAAPAARRGLRGCNCRTGGESDDAGARGWLVLLPLAVLVRRRWRRH
jgi:Ca-activated chloride channel family protein